jgi:putative transposase
MHIKIHLVDTHLHVYFPPMGLRFPDQIHGQCFFITTTFKDWRKMGDTPGLYQGLADSLSFCAGKYGALIIGYVFMPTHIHLILYVDGMRLASFMRDFKKFISQKVSKDLGLKSKAVWMPRYDRVVICSKDVLITKLEYIHNNPVKANLVDSPEKWPWSSAAGYFSDVPDGPVPIFQDWM